ncbi:MAG TPA: DUF2339 domain-containing protein, partial [Candidatus Angelobacter sp.]|nr:DUF2339 domain-containing protein [Candidatus Angelobacter sp.]
MDFSTFLVLLCFTILLIYARKIEKRRRRDAEKHDETTAALTVRIHALEQQSRMSWAAHTGAPPETAQAPKISAPNPAAAPPPVAPPKPVSPIKAEEGHDPQPAPPPEPKVSQVGGIPLVPSAPGQPAPAKEGAHPPIAAAASAGATPAKTEIPAVSHASALSLPLGDAARTPQPTASAASHAAPPLMPGMVKPPQISSRPPVQETGPLSSGVYAQTVASKKGKSISLEEMVGTNWLPKLGVTILVLAVVLFTATKWENLPAIGRVIVFYVLGAGLLGGGIFLERKEKYQILGRVLIGGGWSVLFFITFAMRYVPAAHVLDSDVADLVLLLAMAGAMVWHTLKYNSQTVTGFAFFLGFLSITISHNTSLSLVAGAILALGLTVIVLRRQWYELEVFGILASYLNHLYWLFPIISAMSQKGPFPQYQGSIALMVSYWAIFRASYMLRKVTDPAQESISTIAGLLNPLLFLAVMKYQSFHPEWAFYALLTMGAIEFTLGQLPVSRRRKAPFQILSSLGATLMVMAVPFKYAGSRSLELLWMAGAEVFLLAGIFTRERLFRQFSGIISFLVALYLFAWPPNGISWQVASIVNGQPHHDATLALVFGVVAVLFYFNSHVLGRIWESLFDREVEKQAIGSLSFAASIFAAGAIYVSAGSNAVAVWLAVLVTALAWTGKRFRISQLAYQAHWIALVAIADVSITAIHLDVAWHSIPERLITFGLVAGLLYLSSNFVRMEQPENQEIPVVLYRWAGTGLIALAIWMQVWYAPIRRDWLIAMLWTALALVLAGVAQLLKRSEFKWQAFTLAMMSFCSTLAVNFGYGEQFHHLSYRLISVTLVSGSIYLLARWAPVAQIKPAYSWAGTILLGYLAYRETQEHQELWTAVLWITLAAVLALAARWWKDRALLWQTHLLAAAATGWTIAIAFLGKPEYHGAPAQRYTVLLTAALLYALTWITNIAKVTEDDWIWQSYSWAGWLLLTWLAWYQLAPINVSLAWGVFALVLFELGYNTASAYLRTQAYVALTCSFAHLFYSNFNTLLPAGTFDPHIFLIVLLVPIYFWVYWRLREKADISGRAESKLRIEVLLACIGTATVAALARFEMPPEIVVVGYAALVPALLIAAWWSKQQVFLYQALVMLGVATFRLSMHNLHNLYSSFVSQSLTGAIWAIVLLVAGIPFAFLLRSRPKDKDATEQNWITFLIRRPEQPLFFVRVVLLAVLLALTRKSHADQGGACFESHGRQQTCSDKRASSTAVESDSGMGDSSASE